MGCGVKRWESPVQESVWGRGNCPRVEEEGRTAGRQDQGSVQVQTDCGGIGRGAGRCGGSRV